MAAAAISPSVVKGVRPKIDPSWNPTILDIMEKCWAPQAANRPTVKQARYLVTAIF